MAWSLLPVAVHFPLCVFPPQSPDQLAQIEQEAIRLSEEIKAEYWAVSAKSGGSRSRTGMKESPAAWPGFLMLCFTLFFCVTKLFLFVVPGDGVKDFFFRLASLTFEANVLSELEKSGSRHVGDIIRESVCSAKSHYWEGSIIFTYLFDSFNMYTFQNLKGLRICSTYRETCNPTVVVEAWKSVFLTTRMNPSCLRSGNLEDKADIIHLFSYCQKHNQQCVSPSFTPPYSVALQVHLPLLQMQIF